MYVLYPMFVIIFVVSTCLQHLEMAERGGERWENVDKRQLIRTTGVTCFISAFCLVPLQSKLTSPTTKFILKIS